MKYHVKNSEYYRELLHPPLFSFGMRGDLSMGHSICMSRDYGKEHVYVHSVLLDDYLHSFKMYMQAISPRRSILPYKIQCQIWSINIVEHGHSLGGYREMIYHSRCTPKAPNISHIFSICEKTWATSKWCGNMLYG